MLKRIATLLVYILLLGAMSAMAQDSRRHPGPPHNPEHGYEDRHHHHPDYLVTNNQVFYGRSRVEGASAQTFKILNDGYAKDA